MATARPVQACRPGGSAGTGPSALRAQGGVCCAACSPIRSVRASIAAASSMARRCRAGSAMTGTWADQRTGGCGTSGPVRRRIRASMTAAMSRAPVRLRSPIASWRSWPGSRPASSAARRVRHSHCPYVPGGCLVPGRAARRRAGHGSAARRRAAISACQMAWRMARWSALDRLRWRVWVADSSWPSRVTTWASTCQRCVPVPRRGGGRGHGRPSRRAVSRSKRASSGAGRVPGLGSAVFGERVQT